MRKTTKSPGEKIVKDIKRATRKHYSSEEKIRIVLDGLRDLEGKSETEIKHQLDVINLRWFLRHINIDMLGTHVNEMPDRLHYYAVVHE